MLKVYDKNGNYIRGIVDYKDERIEQELNITDILLFSIPKSLTDLFEEEGYVETKDHGRFVIKEKNIGQDSVEIVGKYDLEELDEWVESKSYVTMNIIDMFDDLLEGTGWTAKYGEEWGRNLIHDSEDLNGKWGTGYQGATATYEKVDMSSEWGFSEAYRIKISGGSNLTKGVWNSHEQGKMSMEFDRDYTFSIYVKNLSDTKMRFLMNGLRGDGNIPIEPGFSGRVSATGTRRENYDWFQALLYTYNLDEEIDIIVGRIKTEKGRISTPWSPNPEGLTLPKRTVTGTNMSIISFIKKAVDTFNYDIKFDNKTKTIYVADELGSDKGVYFHDELNLKRINIDSDSHDFATRLIPVGFDDMGIELINGGLPYVENYSYSNKIKTVYWKDERYTVIENLKEDGIKKLEPLAKPRRSYGTDVVNLAKASKEDYSILDYDIGDTITLIDKDTKTREKQRIMKLVHYPGNPLLDTVEIENRPRILGQEEREEIDNLRESFNVNKASLELFEDSILGRVTDIEGEVIEIKDETDERFGETDARITENEAELEILSTEVSTKVSRTEYDGDYKEITDNYTEFKQEFDNFTSSIQVGGGSNFIKNSVGYGELNYWKLASGEVEFGNNSTWILEGVSKHGWVISEGEMYQTIDLIPNKDYTLSGKYVKSTPAGTLKIELYDTDKEELLETIVDESQEFNGEFTHNFHIENIGTVALYIKVEGASTVNPIELTDLMLAQGENYNYWSQAMGETYTLNVRVDGEGIIVYNTDNQGKTVMSPEEFAGYYNNRKIFTLNGDITEIMGLLIKEKGLFIPPVKFVQTNNSLDIVWTGVM